MYEESGRESDVHAMKMKNNSNGRQKNFQGRFTRSKSANDRNKIKQDLIICYCCGKRGHIGKDCRHRYKVCRKCNRQGHIETACRSQGQQTHHLQSEPKDDDSKDTS